MVNVKKRKEKKKKKAFTLKKYGDRNRSHLTNLRTFL